MNTIRVIGNGKLAHTILNTLSEKDTGNEFIHDIRQFKEDDSYADDNVIFVHVGSGRQYEASVKEAQRRYFVYIQAATEHDIKMLTPQKDDFLFIHAPNLAIIIIKFMYLMKMASPLFSNYTKSITESHQASKQSVAGTAVKLSENLHMDPAKISSIRNIDNQQMLQVTNFNHHAYHRIEMIEGDASLQFISKIEGAAPYVDGLFEIVKIVRKLEMQHYEIEDLVEQGLL